MSEGVAAECVAAQQIYIDREHDRADADSEWTFARHRIDKPQPFPNVVARIKMIKSAK